MYCLTLVLNFSFLPSVSGDKPTLPELVRINLPSRVGPKYHSFGTLLLRDDFGDRVTNIVEDCRGKTEMIMMEILRQWLEGKGVEVSWKSLISTLKDCDLLFMAKQIEMAS